MAIVADTTNHFKYVLLNAIAGHTLKAILMNTTFVFDRDAHATLADVTADQLATGNGYTQNNKVLSNVAVTEDDVNDRAQFTCDDVTWTAASGNIGPFGALVIVDETAVEATEFFTTATDRTFTGGLTNWANGNIGTTFDDTGDLSLVASATGQYCGITFTNIGTALVAGGLYRLTYDYSETTAGFEFQIQGAATQTLGDAVAGTSQTIDFYADESFTGAHELRIVSKTNAAAGDFDNFSLKELGAIVGNIDFGTDYTIVAGSSWTGKDLVINLGIGS
jgi:hypothetical protein